MLQDSGNAMYTSPECLPKSPVCLSVFWHGTDTETQYLVINTC